jgi:hypothetical protein
MEVSMLLSNVFGIRREIVQAISVDDNLGLELALVQMILFREKNKRRGMHK